MAADVPGASAPGGRTRYMNETPARPDMGTEADAQHWDGGSRHRDDHTARVEVITE